MSHNTDSGMSSPVSLSNPGSLLSETCRELELDHAQSDNKCPACHLNNSTSMKEHETHGMGTTRGISDTVNVVDMGRGDIDLQVNNTVFKTHMHLLCNFTRLEEMVQSIERQDSSSFIPSIKLYRDERGVEDITNTFKILYASVIKGPFNFDPPVLISALRMATVYDYPDLRAFSIEHLEKASLSAIQRIQLAREFDLVSWEGPAYDELSKRDEAITDEEAEVLGVVAFAKVARAREAEKLKKGKEIGEREHKEKIRKEQEEKVRKEKEEKAKKKAEEKAKKAAEEKAKKEAEEKAKKAAEEKAKKEAEEKKAAEEKVKKEAEEKAKKKAEEKAREEAEEKARKENEENAKRDVEERAKKEAEERAKKETEEKAKKEAEERARKAEEERARREAEAKAKKAAEEKAEKEAEERARRAAAAELPYFDLLWW